MNSFLLIGLAPEDTDDSAPNAPADTTTDSFSALLTNVQKQFADQGDHLDLCKLSLDGSAEAPVTAQLAHATYDCILLGGGFREPEHLALFERVINTVHRHAPGAAIGLVNLPQAAPEAALRVLSQDYKRAGLLSPSASRKELSMTPNLVTLNPDAGYVTILNTYTVAPERAEELLQTLVRSTNETLQYVPGFVSASFHMNLDRTQVVNYSQWLSQEAIKAAGTDPKVQASMKEVGQIADKFTPILYELRDSVMAA